jgi:hypothetical protein
VVKRICAVITTRTVLVIYFRTLYSPSNHISLCSVCEFDEIVGLRSDRLSNNCLVFCAVPGLYEYISMENN